MINPGEKYFLVTNDKTILQWFQLCINHHLLATNKNLHKIKYTDNLTCTFCAEQVETIHHLLWDCKHTKVMIQDLKSWLADNNIFINIHNRNTISVWALQ